MKRVLKLYTIVIYGIWFFLFMGGLLMKVLGTVGNVFTVLYLACMLLSMIIGIVNLVCAIKEAKKDTPDCFRTILTFKLIHIPFYIINFLAWFILALAAANPFLMWMWLFIPVAIVYTYGVLLSTSLYACTHLLARKRNGKQQKIWYHVLLQLTFVLDVVDSVFLYVKYKDTDRQMVEMQ